MRPLLAPLLLCACIALVLASCKTTRAPEIHGRVSPRTPAPVPANAVLEVQVADVTRAGERPVVVARRLYMPLAAPPWRFTLRADSLTALDPSHTYAVQARVLVHGKPLLVSKRRTVVDPARLADTLDVVVEPVPRTVGARIGSPAGERAGVWNPLERPATLPEPISTLPTGLAGGSETIPARGPLALTKRPE